MIIIAINTLHHHKFGRALSMPVRQHNRSAGLLMHRAHPRPFRTPPLSNAFVMEFAETFQPSHLVSHRELLKADHAFCIGLAVRTNAVFLCGEIDYHPRSLSSRRVATSQHSVWNGG